jgi:hypothetical protein
MAIYLKKFSTHQEYEAFTATTAFIKPNVSICTTEGDVHYNPLKCEESSTYELVGTPSYPSEVDGANTSFDMTFNYKRTDINEKCKETITEGSDTVTVEIGTNPSTASSRTVEGTYDYHGLEIAYSVTQTKFEAKITAKVNVTDTSSPTRIASGTSNISAIEIDGVKQGSVTTGYTFDAVGEHTVKYTLKDQTSIGRYDFAGCSSLTSIDIPNSVTSIDSSTFERCSGLTSCTIGSGVTSIGQSAFSYCTSLTSIDIPSGVTSIGQSAFNGCSRLTSCTIGNGVTSIGNYAFVSCRSLTSIDIPSGVTSIGQSAFQDCSSLTSIDIPSGVTSIGRSAFDFCSSLTSINIPNGVTSIGQSAFLNCNSLTSIDIPSGVTSIGNSAFSYCSSLTSIEIPSGVTSIGDETFRYCTRLTSVTINATTPPTLVASAFYNTNNCPIYVPSASVETYKSTSGWSSYASRIQAIP